VASLPITGLKVNLGSYKNEIKLFIRASVKLCIRNKVWRLIIENLYLLVSKHFDLKSQPNEGLAVITLELHLGCTICPILSELVGNLASAFPTNLPKSIIGANRSVTFAKANDQTFVLKDKWPMIGSFAPIRATQFVHCSIQDILRTHTAALLLTTGDEPISFLPKRSPVLPLCLICCNFQSPACQP